MKSVLFPLAAMLVAAGPAAAQTVEAPPPPPPSGTPSNVLSMADLPFANLPAPTHLGRCFNGSQIVAANRAGSYTLYLQTRRGPIWRVGLAEPCEALRAAEKLSVRTEGGHSQVCEMTRAKLIVQTAAGPQRCKLVGKPALLTRQELASLTTPRR